MCKNFKYKVSDLVMNAIKNSGAATKINIVVSEK
jgi:hypothetical protein